MNVNTATNTKIKRMCEACLANFKNPEGVKPVDPKDCTTCRIAEDWKATEAEAEGSANGIYTPADIEALLKCAGFEKTSSVHSGVTEYHASVGGHLWQLNGGGSGCFEEIASLDTPVNICCFKDSITDVPESALIHDREWLTFGEMLREETAYDFATPMQECEVYDFVHNQRS